MNRRDCLKALVGVCSGGGTMVARGAGEQAHNLSLIRLIANPNDYDGQRVRLVGYLAPGGGPDWTVGLYVSELDGRNHIIDNSIYLYISESKVRKIMWKYVILNATFHAPKGDLAKFVNGSLHNISDLEVWVGGL